MKRPNWRPVIATIVVALTITVFTTYFISHPEVRQQLSQISARLLLGLLALYLVSIVALAFVTIATIRLCKVRLKTEESLLLTMYTAVINFFGPLQSGPAFRAVYLKQRHGISLKRYTSSTLVYYFFYGGFSVMMLFSGVLGWWLVPLLAAGLAFLFIASRHGRLKPRFEQLDLRGWYYLAAATLAQVVVITLIYYTELRNVQPGVHVSQAVIYTGAANLALFVSLTPGAIGFRESFLVFSQNLHHISNSTIVAANILDRAVYIMVLLILAFVIFATHARRQFNITTKT